MICRGISPGFLGANRAKSLPRMELSRLTPTSTPVSFECNTCCCKKNLLRNWIQGSSVLINGAIKRKRPDKLDLWLMGIRHGASSPGNALRLNFCLLSIEHANFPRSSLTKMNLCMPPACSLQRRIPVICGDKLTECHHGRWVVQHKRTFLLWLFLLG